MYSFFKKSKNLYMQMMINGDRLVRDVQQEFSRVYPFLKIEFFRINGLQKAKAIKENQIKHDQKLRSAKGRDIKKGDLVIDDVMSVADLEKAFMAKFGLITQVFRKSGNIWLETTITDSWSLKQQNEMGREITTGKKPGEMDEDYDLNRDAD
jgi:glycerol-3-phosphate O-acyltransferase